jgi:hypothetical protein
MLSRLRLQATGGSETKPAGPAPFSSQSTIGGHDRAASAFCRMPSGGPAARWTLPLVDRNASPRRDRFEWLLSYASGMSREPFPASMGVREARDAYLAENGFTVESYDAPRTEASFLGIRFSVPNTPRHRVAIMLHDLHHVATGFGTDFTGEGEISAWEARSGLGALGGYVGGIVTSGFAGGLLLAPVRTARAWGAARGAKSLFPTCRLPEADFAARYEELLAMTVGELRAALGVAPGGAAGRPRRLHAYAPKGPLRPA